MSRLGAVVACLLLLTASACAFSPIPVHGGGPGCYASNGRDDLVMGAALIATATGGESKPVSTGDCDEGARAVVSIHYPSDVSRRTLETRIANLAYCSPNTIAKPTSGTPLVYDDWFCVPSSIRLRVSVAYGEEVGSLIYLA